MADPEIRGVAPWPGHEAGKERAAVRALLRSEFEVAPGVGDAFARLYDSLLETDPAVTPDCSRVAVVGGRVVGHALLAPRSIHVCEGVCPGGLIGMVVVHPGFRGQGIASRLIADVHRVARERAIGLLVLAGDPGFYRQFGYHHAFVNSTCLVEAITPSTLSPDPLRSATCSDIDTLAALSEKNTPPGSVVRNPARWSWILESQHPGGLLKVNPAMLGFEVTEDRCMIDPAGKGYIRIARHGSGATIYEAGLVLGSSGEMLEQVRSLCKSEGLDHLRMRLFEDHPLVQASQCPVVTEVDGEFQFRIIDLDVFLDAAAKGFEERIVRAFPDWEGCLSFQTDTELIQFSKRSGTGVWLREQDLDGEGEGEFKLSIPEWGMGRMLLGQDDVLKTLNEGEIDSIDGQVLRAAVRSPKPTFTLTDAI
jgi:predicted N-acetyltransferase YhbS